MGKGKLHYGRIVIFMGMFTTIAAHDFGRMAYTIILPAMKDGLHFDYTQLGLLGTGNSKTSRYEALEGPRSEAYSLYAADGRFSATC